MGFLLAYRSCTRQLGSALELVCLDPLFYSKIDWVHSDIARIPRGPEVRIAFPGVFGNAKSRLACRVGVRTDELTPPRLEMLRPPYQDAALLL